MNNAASAARGQGVGRGMGARGIGCALHAWGDAGANGDGIIFAAALRECAGNALCPSLLIACVAADSATADLQDARLAEFMVCTPVVIRVFIRQLPWRKLPWRTELVGVPADILRIIVWDSILFWDFTSTRYEFIAHIHDVCTTYSRLSATNCTFLINKNSLSVMPETAKQGKEQHNDSPFSQSLPRRHSRESGNPVNMCNE